MRLSENSLLKVMGLLILYPILAGGLLGCALLELKVFGIDSESRKGGVYIGILMMLTCFLLVPALSVFGKRDQPMWDRIKEIPKRYVLFPAVIIRGTVNVISSIFPIAIVIAIAAFILLGIAGLLLFGIKQIF